MSIIHLQSLFGNGRHLDQQISRFYDNYPEIIHVIFRHSNNEIDKQLIMNLEQKYFLGVKIFKELTEYCFNPQRLTRLCNIYNIEMCDYMEII